MLSANIQVVHSILKNDYKIRIATSGAKALDLVKANPLPDLVLLDVCVMNDRKFKGPLRFCNSR